MMPRPARSIETIQKGNFARAAAYGVMIMIEAFE